MSVKLHYGPPGSYKTSGAIADDLPVAVKEGRVLITNIRGLENADLVKQSIRKSELTIKNLLLRLIGKFKSSVNDDFSIMHFDTKKESERDKLRRFYHWAPQDAYFILDEINTIWPADWRPTKLKEFDLHTGRTNELLDVRNHLHDRHGEVCLDIETQEPIIRAQNLTEALEMHRHFNYDFSATSPSYKKFNAVFHDVAEVAFGHANRAIIGFKGSYWETMHEATNTGRSKTDKLSVDVKRIPKWVFNCYQSTATGETRDSSAGSNLFLKPKILFPIFLSLAMILYGVFELQKMGFIKDSAEVQNVKTGIETPDKTNITKSSNTLSDKSESTNNDIIDGGQNPNVIPPTSRINDHLQDYKIYIGGILWDEKVFSVERQHETSTLNLDALNQLGYELTFFNKCMAKMTHKQSNTERLILCRPLSNQGSMGQRVNFNTSIGNLSSE